jgi:hypothetical protein
MNWEETQMELFEPEETIRRVEVVHKNIIEILTKERFYDAQIDRSIREHLQRFIPYPDIDEKLQRAPLTDRYQKIQQEEEYWLKRIFGQDFHLRSNEQ